MIDYLRVSAAALLISILASPAWASSPQDAATTAPGDAQASSLPVAPVPPPVDQDFGVQQASDSESSLSATPVSAPGASQASDQSSCGACDGCSGCMSCCEPLWEVTAGAVILHRDRPTAGAIVAANPGTTTAFSSGTDFNFGWNAGPDIAIDRRIGDDNFLDLRYFNSYGTANVAFVTPGAFIGAGFTGPGGTTFAGSDLTKLNSTEINWKHQAWDQLALLAGFRAIELKDDLSYTINHTVASSQYDYNNHLYGGQFGADWSLTRRDNPLQINIVGKAGVFGNSDDGGLTSFQPVGTPIRVVTGQGTTTSFVGDLDCTASYALTSHISIRGGYELLWLTNLALAPDAASRSLTNPFVLSTVSDSDHLFYQGANVAVDFVW